MNTWKETMTMKAMRMDAVLADAYADCIACCGNCI